MVDALGNEKAPGIQKNEAPHPVEEFRSDRSDQKAMSHVNFTAPYELHRAMKRLAFEGDRPIREIYLEAVRHYIETHGRHK